METVDYLLGVKKLVGDELFEKVAKKYPLELRTFPASTKLHHAEVGGYIRHVWEVINFCSDLTDNLANYQMEVGDRTEKFNIDTLIKLAFIHDLDKLTRYELDPEEPTAKQCNYARTLGIEVVINDCKSSLSCKIDNKKNGKNNFVSYYRYRDQPAIGETARVVIMCLELGISLNEDEVHCIEYHHGGWSNIAKAPMSPMACILHCADLMSAKILGNDYGS